MVSHIVHWLRDFLLDCLAESAIKQGAGYVLRRVGGWVTKLFGELLALFFAPLILPAIYESLSKWIRRALIALTVAGTVAALIFILSRVDFGSRPLQAIPRA